MQTNLLKKEFIAYSSEEMHLIAEAYANPLKRGDIVALIGPLGAGKTTFVRGLASAWGIPPGEVVSPTFTIFNVYRGRDFPIYHFDLYRLESLRELEAIGYEEFWGGDGVTLVEWFDKFEIPHVKEYLQIRFEHLTEQSRKLSLTLFP